MGSMSKQDFSKNLIELDRLELTPCIDDGEVSFRNGSAVHELTAQLLQDRAYIDKVTPISVIPSEIDKACWKVVDGVRRIRAFRNAFLVQIPVQILSHNIKLKSRSTNEVNDLLSAFGALKVGSVWNEIHSTRVRTIEPKIHSILVGEERKTALSLWSQINNNVHERNDDEHEQSIFIQALYRAEGHLVSQIRSTCKVNNIDCSNNDSRISLHGTFAWLSLKCDNVWECILQLDPVSRISTWSILHVTVASNKSSVVVLCVGKHLNQSNGKISLICWSLRDPTSFLGNCKMQTTVIVKTSESIAHAIRIHKCIRQCLVNPTRLVTSLLETKKKGDEVVKGDVRKVHLPRTILHRSSSLNTLQHRAMRGFLDAAENTWHTVQGPPGCGKTHMIVSALRECRRDSKLQRRRVLVCAPSNQALDVLFNAYTRDQSTVTSVHHSAVLLRSLAGQKRPHMCDDTHQMRESLLNEIEKLLWTVNVPESALLHAIEQVRLQWLLGLTQHPQLPDQPTIVQHLQYNLLDVLETLAQVEKSHLYDANHRHVLCNKALFTIQCVLRPWARRSDVRMAWQRASQFVFTTLGNLLTRSQIDWQSALGSFDHLIIDESGQASLVESLYAVQVAGLSERTKVWLIGDPCQLGPCSIGEVDDMNAVPTLMDVLITLYKSFPQRTTHTMLTTQYRMHPAICSWPNAMFYASKLRCARKTMKPISAASSQAIPSNVTFSASSMTEWLRENTVALTSGGDLSPYLFFNVGNSTERVGCSGSKSNYQEAIMISQACSWLKTQYTSKSIAIVSFYADQVSELRRYVGSTVTLHTVDSFQGGESDIVLISFVRSNRYRQAGFIRDARRLNVALTRARQCLWLFGHAATLERANQDNDDKNHNDEICILTKLIRDAKSRSLYVTLNSSPNVTLNSTP